MELRFTGVGLNTAHGSSAQQDQRRREHDTSGGSEPEAYARREAPDEFCDNSEDERDDGETEQVIGTGRGVCDPVFERVMTRVSLCNGT